MRPPFVSFLLSECLGDLGRMQYAHAEDPAFLLEYPSSFPSSSASLIDQEQLILGSEVEMAGSSRTTEDGVSVERESADHSFT